MTDPKAVLTAWLDHVDRTQDANAALERYADPCEFIGPGGTVARTPREVRDFAAGLSATLSDIRHEATNWIVSGDRVAFEFLLIGVHTGTFPGPDGELPPTGKTVRLRCAGLYRVKDDKIVEAHAYFDRLDLLTQLGAVNETRSP